MKTSTSSAAASDISTTPSFSEVVRMRRSPRRFLSQRVPAELMRAVLEEAQCSPSNSNTQPWLVHIVSGAARDRLSAALIEDAREDRRSPDFVYDPRLYEGLVSERARDQTRRYFASMEIDRELPDARIRSRRRNTEFFDAPHAAFLFMPHYGEARMAGDLGMYGQTFLLSLAAHGLAGIPQTLLGFYADTVREHLGIAKEFKLLFGISFGYPDPEWLATYPQMPRAPIEEIVTFHED